MTRSVWYLALAASAVCGYIAGAGRAASDPREQLLAADRAFDDKVSGGGLEAWVSHFTEDGKMMPAGGNVVEGREAIREQMAPAFGRPGFSLRWKPVFAEISRSRDLGYTIGQSESRGLDKEGKPVVQYGKYLTVWRRQKDGSWKVAADIGNPRPAGSAVRPGPPESLTERTRKH